MYNINQDIKLQRKDIGEVDFSHPICRCSVQTKVRNISIAPPWAPNAVGQREKGEWKEKESGRREKKKWKNDYNFPQLICL